MIRLNVSDLKQYIFCPRTVFYQYVMPVKKVMTFKMECGKIEEGKINRLEYRRKLRRYGLSEGKREFHKRIYSEKLGLSGQLDLLIKTFNGLYPVDFKFSTSRPHKNHIYQITGYALILEDLYGSSIGKGFVYMIPSENAHVFRLTEKIKSEALSKLDDMRNMILTQMMPDAQQKTGKCRDCEYANFCGDIY